MAIRSGSGLLPDFGISEKIFGRGTYAPRQNFPIDRSQFAKSRTGGQVLGVRQTNPFQANQSIDSGQQYGSPIGPATFGTPLGRQGTGQIRTGRSTVGQVAPPPKLDLSRGTAAKTQNTNTVQGGDAAARALADETALYEQQYTDTANYLNNLQSEINRDLDTALGNVGGEFGLYRQQLETAQNQLLDRNQQAQQQQQVQTKSALDKARSDFVDLTKANQLRYGGTTGTAEFANALQGREYQRGQTGITQTAQQNLQQLRNQAADIQTQYQSNLQALQQQEAQAREQLRSQFTERLRQIDLSKFNNEQQKQSEKLNLLREFRDRAQSLEEQRQSFQQQLEAQTLAAAQNIFGAIQEYRAGQGLEVDLNALPGVGFSQVGGGESIGQDVQLPTGYFRRQDEETL